MQQQDGWICFIAGLAVKNVDTIDVYCVVKNLPAHPYSHFKFYARLQLTG